MGSDSIAVTVSAADQSSLTPSSDTNPLDLLLGQRIAKLKCNRNYGPARPVLYFARRPSPIDGLTGSWHSLGMLPIFVQLTGTAGARQRWKGQQQANRTSGRSIPSV